MNTTITMKFSASIGIVAGYGGEEILTSAEKIPADAMAKAWQEVAAEVMKETGIYVSAIITPAKVLYHTDWGCPIGGEPVFELSGSLNPQFAERDAWMNAVEACVRKVKTKFGQSTVTVEFWEVQHLYITD